MTTYAIYDLISGKISKTIFVPEGYSTDTVEDNTGPGESNLIVEDDVTARTHYVNPVGAPMVIELSNLTDDNVFTNTDTWLADGVDQITFGPSLPNPTQYFIESDAQGLNGAVGEVTDGQFELTTPAAGNFRITFTAFPYKPLTILVTAN